MCRGQVLSATASPAAPVSFKAHLDCVSGVDVQFDAAASTFQVASSSWDLRCVHEREKSGERRGALWRCMCALSRRIWTVSGCPVVRLWRCYCVTLQCKCVRVIHSVVAAEVFSR